MGTKSAFPHLSIDYKILHKRKAMNKNVYCRMVNSIGKKLWINMEIVKSSIKNGQIKHYFYSAVASMCLDGINV